MTGIIQELNEQLQQTNRQCSYIKAIENLTKEEQEELTTALNQDFPTTLIHKVIRKRKINVSYTAIGRHRRSECICEL